MDRQAMMDRARKIGEVQGHQAWSQARIRLLGGTTPGKIHYENALRIVYALEEEDSTIDILPHPQLRPGAEISDWVNCGYSLEDLRRDIGECSLPYNSSLLEEARDIYANVFTTCVEKEAYLEAKRMCS